MDLLKKLKKEAREITNDKVFTVYSLDYNLERRVLCKAILDKIATIQERNGNLIKHMLPNASTESIVMNNSSNNLLAKSTYTVKEGLKLYIKHDHVKALCSIKK